MCRTLFGLKSVRGVLDARFGLWSHFEPGEAGLCQNPSCTIITIFDIADYYYDSLGLGEAGLCQNPSFARII